jgi:hypothetical protein
MLHNIFKTLAVLLLMLFSQNLLADQQMLSLLQELKAEIQTLKTNAEIANNRISELEKQLAQSQKPTLVSNNSPQSALTTSNTPTPVASNAETTAPEKPAIRVGDVKGTFKIPGTDTSIGMGGFVKMDTLFSNVSAGRDKLGDQQLVFSQIPVGRAPGEHSQTTFLAKDSRLWFKSFTPSNWGDINTYMEFDFYGDPATYSYTPRLRHAYGSIGNFLAGQTWTTYTNISASPDHLESGTSAGALSTTRQPLIRWTQALNGFEIPIEIQAALETPRSRVWVPNSIETNTSNGANGTNPISDNFLTTPNAERYPDLIARVNFKPEWGNISFAALGRQIRYTQSATGLEAGNWGGGLNVAGKINSLGLDTFRFMAHVGNGAGRYTTTTNTFEDAALSEQGDLSLIKTFGGMVSYQHWWNKQWRSNLTYGYAAAKQPEFVNPLLNQQVQSVHANLVWSPISQTTLGMEYIFAERELINGQKGELQRIQFSARYSF